MNNINPTMQQALSACLPPGFRSPPVMSAVAHLQGVINDMRTRLANYDAPPAQQGQFAYTYQHPELGALECHMEHEPAAPECGWFESATLCAAYLRGVDVFDRLEQKEIDAIEIDVAKKARERYFDAAGEE